VSASLALGFTQADGADLVGEVGTLVGPYHFKVRVPYFLDTP
jgi:hypothetical protein